MTDINKEYEKEYYDEYRNNYYNPDDDDAEPGINLNWKRIQKGFHRVAAGDQETAETLSGMQANLETLNTDVETLKTDVEEIKTAVDDLDTAVDTAEQAAASAAASEAAAEAAQAAIEEIAESIPDDYSELSETVDLIYDYEKASDTYGENASVYGTAHNTYTAAWDAQTKTLTMSFASALSTTTTCLTHMLPKFQANHTYKIVVKPTWTDSATFKNCYIWNRPYLTNLNDRQEIVNGDALNKDTVYVYTFTANIDGYADIGLRTIGGDGFTFSEKIAIYDVTGADMTGVSDDIFKTFEDTIIFAESGILPPVVAAVNTHAALLMNVTGEKWAGLGDSLTAAGSGGYYLTYTKDKLMLSDYANCGIGGTAVSGAQNVNAMYQDVRINALPSDAVCVTIMGGTNDIWQEYYKDHPNDNFTGWGDITRENYDVQTFAGAYNVMLSKIMYKYCKVPGYYENIDYTGITQLETAVNNFRLILLTPPQCFHGSADTISATTKLRGITTAHSYVKQIAKLWGLPCVDTWEMGMNDINKSLFFTDAATDATHINVFGHKRLASLLIDTAIKISRYQ